jgi:diadenosine tetraphosphate (Ap4A) HIT family hydrolase
MTPCLFCCFDRARLVAQTEVAIALLDAFPITEGHILVVPGRHVVSVYNLSSKDQRLCGSWLGRYGRH